MRERPESTIAWRGAFLAWSGYAVLALATHLAISWFDLQGRAAPSLPLDPLTGEPPMRDGLDGLLPASVAIVVAVVAVTYFGWRRVQQLGGLTRAPQLALMGATIAHVAVILVVDPSGHLLDVTLPACICGFYGIAAALFLEVRFLILR